MTKKRVTLTDAQKDRLAAKAYDPDGRRSCAFVELPDRDKTYWRRVVHLVVTEAAAMASPAKKPGPKSKSPMDHQLENGHCEQESKRETKGDAVRMFIANSKESMLSWYRARKLIADHEFTAGNRLYSDYYQSGREASAAALDSDKVDGGGNKGPTDRQMDAAAAYDGAMRAMGPHLSPVLVHVCVLSGNASDWAKARGFSDKAGVPLLKIALRTLADHYVGVDKGHWKSSWRREDVLNPKLIAKLKNQHLDQPTG